ncbi:MAG: hypothetical protein AB9842_01645 [Bacteroidales bacterium]
MKKSIAFLFTSLALLFSCTTDFDINGEWQDITVVYGLMNQNDSLTYIKINKAFLGEGDALMMAQVPDSSEYKNPLEVKVEEWSNGSLVKTFFFDTTTIYNKEPGIFYYPDQILYKANTRNQLNVESTYKLVVHNPVSGNTFRSQTILVYPFTIELPKPSQKIMGFSTEGTSKVRWKTGKNGRRYQLMIKFNYKEVPISGGDTVFKSVDWLFPSTKSSYLDGNEEIEMSYSNPYFYDLIRSKIIADAGVQRFIGKKGSSEYDFGAIEFIFSVASDEFSTFLDVYEPSTGIVQEKPDFTNIISENEAKGLGIFSSRFQVFRSYKMEDLTKGRIKEMNLGF